MGASGDADTAPDAWRRDAAPHDRLEVCRDWCPDFIGCLAVQCGESLSGAGTHIATGWCIDECQDGVYTEYQQALDDPTEACRAATAGPRQRQQVCRDNAFQTCQGLCSGDEPYLIACYGVDSECEEKCEDRGEDEFRCAGYRIGMLNDEGAEPDEDAFCDALKACLDWPRD